MRDGDMTTKRDGELLAELLDIPKAVFETRTLREIMTAPQAIKGIGEKCKKGTIITCYPLWCYPCKTEWKYCSFPASYQQL